MIEQRTPEWYEARNGKITASRIAPIMVKKKDGSWGDGAITLMYKLIGERMAIVPEQGVKTYAMQAGTDMEPEAKEFYTKQSGFYVSDVPFKELDGHPEIGASSDNLVFADMFDKTPIRCAEYKCHSSMEHHIAHWFEEPESAHYAQMQLNMLVWGLDECDYVSYNPNCKVKMHIRTIPADKEYQADMVERCERFIKDMFEKMKEIK